MATALTGSVGQGGVNKPADVKAVRALLQRHAAVWLAPDPPPAADGPCDDALVAAIKRFQGSAAALLKPDGKVDPGGFSLARLDMAAIPKPTHPVLAGGAGAHAVGSPTDADYQAAATQLGCEVACIKAVSQVEVGVTGCWDPQGRPRILFERHVFSNLTSGRYDATHSDISNPVQGGYGPFSGQYPKLYRAATLDEASALQSASWGAYQIVGRYYAQAGFGDVATFASAEMQNEKRQLDAFVSYVLASPACHSALKAKQWTRFARAYNGPKYKENDYDTKMADAYAALAPPPPKGAAAGRPGAGAPLLRPRI